MATREKVLVAKPDDLKFDTWDPRDGRKELTRASCRLTSTCYRTRACTHTWTTNVNKVILQNFKDAGVRRGWRWRLAQESPAGSLGGLGQEVNPAKQAISPLQF